MKYPGSAFRNRRAALAPGILTGMVLLGLALGTEGVASNWPSFRGSKAQGVSDGQNLPDQWNGETGLHIKWKAAIPGLAHSSPVVWDDRLFVTSAISSQADATFKPGTYGDGKASDDQSLHRWRVYCLDRKSGKLLTR